MINKYLLQQKINPFGIINIEKLINGYIQNYT